VSLLFALTLLFLTRLDARLCISELVAALVRMDADEYGQGRDYRGLVNTAWTRVTVGVKV